MARNMHLADGKMLRHYRKNRGLTLQQVQDRSLVLAAFVSVSSLKAMEACRRPVKLITIECYAKVLEVPLAFVQGQPVGQQAEGVNVGLLPLRSWQTVLEGTLAPHQVCLALGHDMAGRHRLALDVLDQALRSLAESESESESEVGAGNGTRPAQTAGDSRTWRNRAFLLIKRGSILSNMGEHHPALEIFDTLLADPGARRRRTSDIVAWARHHRAVICRRLGRLDEARTTFQELTRRKPHRNAAWHHLGVVEMLQADEVGTAPSRRAGLLASAEKSFLKSLDGWGWNRGKVHYRSGFSLRRLGQLYTVSGRLSEAYGCLKDACSVFEQEDCARYARATREELDEFVGLHGSYDN